MKRRQSMAEDWQRCISLQDISLIEVPISSGGLNFPTFPVTVNYPISFFDFSKERMAEEIMSLLQRIKVQGENQDVIRILLPMQFHESGSVKDLG